VSLRSENNISKHNANDHAGFFIYEVALFLRDWSFFFWLSDYVSL
jgi:hypothetical protein